MKRRVLVDNVQGAFVSARKKGRNDGDWMMKMRKEWNKRADSDVRSVSRRNGDA